MNDKEKFFKQYHMHTSAKVVVTYSTPGEELLVREDGSFYEDTSVETYDLNDYEQAQQLVNEIQFSAAVREHAWQCHQKEKGLIKEVDQSLLRFIK